MAIELHEQVSRGHPVWLAALWLGVVFFNSLSGIFWASCWSQEPAWYAGIATGIAVVWLIFCVLDVTLLQEGNTSLSDALRKAALYRGVLQILPPIDIFAGWLFMFYLPGLIPGGAFFPTHNEFAYALLLTLCLACFHALFLVAILVCVKSDR